ncbi:inhibitor of nuclear factor kappa-B kinase subunit beta isoform X2 [Tachysurus fulvidraco]|nr:inhibitor of nuclear factor kappa-B kinase subunit beta isoform X2 [Tachysurus fulvidraco]XP_047679074.1 inhibitor of nuclear factor kappa-B kinase subunit beta isoform X2 [Tachysurus fulvidraco]
MKRLNHVNVVAAREVPEELQKLATNDLPLLAMEYCQGGDLRKYLNLLENCCGMREGSVLILLRDISSALKYLHTKRIIHRDLKPENIVLQQGEKRLIHKIIDLGYAKELDQSSLCTSFVGTLQYLAPELLEQQKYTVTVDYWSFGTLVFECITGFRPFLPTWQPVPWHNKLKQKHEDDVVVYEDLAGEVHFSKHLPRPHNLNDLLAGMLEHWLQLMLRWSPQDRGKDAKQISKERLNGTENKEKTKKSEEGGRDPQSGSNYCFEKLDRILDLKLVMVLNMTSAEICTYTVQHGETVASLQKRIEQDVHIPLTRQELLLEAGLALEPHNEIMHCAVDYASVDGRRADMPLVFLFNRSYCSYEPQFNPRILPENIGFIQTEPKRMLPYSAQRRTYGQAWHTIRALKEDWLKLQQGQKAAIMSLLRHNGLLSKQKNEMVSVHQRLKATLEFFTTSLHIDMDKYQEQRATGIASEKLLNVWREMEQTALSHGQIDDVTMLEEEMMKLQTDIVDLQRHPWRSGEALESLEGKAMDLFRKLREKPRDQRGNDDCHEVVKLVVQAIQFYEKKLKEFYTHLSKTMVCRQRVMELLPRVEGMVSSMAQCEQELRCMQEKRQKELWNLLKVACSKVRSPVSGSPEEGRTPPSSSPSLFQQRPLHPNSLIFLQQPEESMIVIEESKTFESRMQSLVQETIKETEINMQVLQEWTWLNRSQDLSLYYT